MSVELIILRVFTDAAGRHGNPLGVVLDGRAVPAADRQAIARDLGFSETVFVDDRHGGAIQIFTPSSELGFAGHPSVGTAWLLAAEGTPVDTLRPPAGEVAVRRGGGMTFIAALSQWVQPPYHFTELDSAAAVDAASGPPRGVGQSAIWAWEDKTEGAVRSRVFPVSIGIAEDEATGAAAIQMAAIVGRPLTIRQGRGSRLLARPLDAGWAEVGGTVTLDERRRL